MAQDHTLMASRYELKYLIPNAVALRVRHFVRQYLELDEYGVGLPNGAYPVHSLYLDSDDWQLYWRTFNGDKNRYKLRIRYYNESEKTPLFWEIKRRMKDVIIKQRCGIRRSCAAQVLNGQLPARNEMIAPDDPAELVAIQEFLRLQFDVVACGKMHIAYDREAYVNDRNNEVRVTFDRHVRAATRFDQTLPTRMDHPFECTGRGDAPDDLVILELKFSGRFPDWYRDLVQTFDLQQTGAAKYLDGTLLYAGRDQDARDVIRNLIF